MARQSPLGQDFRRLWSAYAISAAGSAVGMGALPLIALLCLDVSAFQVSLLAALSAVASGMIALPLGVRIEHQYKRPVMITADLARCAVLASVPAAMAFDGLTFAHLCAVGVLQTAASVAFDAASGAHLKALVVRDQRLRANSLFETTNWITVSAGPPVGGFLIGVLGAATTLVVDALSFLGSALGIRRIQRPEPAPPARCATSHLGRDVAAGWQYLLRHPGLRPLFFNALLFGGAIMMASPLMAVLMLDDLGLAPWQYGLPSECRAWAECWAHAWLRCSPGDSDSAASCWCRVWRGRCGRFSCRWHLPAPSACSSSWPPTSACFSPPASSIRRSPPTAWPPPPTRSCPASPRPGPSAPRHARPSA
ncbi:MFS transporter [Streptomyces pseudogriseolus]|uniref:MFS transporter n=1 Tax=Streptomyces pseudogriseolus TaxID=36817 RepID=UPI0034898E40